LTLLLRILGNYDEGFGGEKHAKKWAPQTSKFSGVEKVTADNKRASVEVNSGHSSAPKHVENSAPVVEEPNENHEPAVEHHEPAVEHHEEPACEQAEEEHEVQEVQGDE